MRPQLYKLLRSAVENANYVSAEKGLDVDVDRLIREARHRQRRPAHEAHPSGSDGTRLPLSAPHLAHRDRAGGEGVGQRYKADLVQTVEAGAAGQGRPRRAAEEGAGQEVGGQESSGEEEVGGARSPPRKSRRLWDRKSIHTDFASASPSRGDRAGSWSATTTNCCSRTYKLKAELKDKLKSAGVSSIEIERPGNKLRIIIRTARPGIIIGRKGAEIDKLKQEIQKRTNREVYVDIQEVHKPELDAQLVSENIALQLEKRVGFRRAMRKAVDSALRFGCKGIKVRVSGRLNGNEIARSEWYLQGRLPLHTLRADIDYGFTEARTTYGVIGVKVWVYKGEIYPREAPRTARRYSRERFKGSGQWSVVSCQKSN